MPFLNSVPSFVPEAILHGMKWFFGNVDLARRSPLQSQGSISRVVATSWKLSIRPMADTPHHVHPLADYVLNSGRREARLRQSKATALQVDNGAFLGRLTKVLCPPWFRAKTPPIIPR
jgi:hypothetical protein